MNDINGINRYLETIDKKNDELLNRIILNKKSKCSGFFLESLDINNLGLSLNLYDCNIIEIIVNLSVNISNLRNLILDAGYRILDITYSPEYCTYLIKKMD